MLGKQWSHLLTRECCQAEDGIFGWVGGACGTSQGWKWASGPVIYWSGDQKRGQVCASNRESRRSGILNSCLQELADGTPVWQTSSRRITGGDYGELASMFPSGESSIFLLYLTKLPTFLFRTFFFRFSNTLSLLVLLIV